MKDKKPCTRCREEKAIDDFYYNSSGWYFAECKVCFRQRTAEYKKLKASQKALLPRKIRKNARKYEISLHPLVKKALEGIGL